MTKAAHQHQHFLLPLLLVFRTRLFALIEVTQGRQPFRRSDGATVKKLTVTLCNAVFS